MKKAKRLLSLILAVTMLMSALSTGFYAFAVGVTPTEVEVGGDAVGLSDTITVTNSPQTSPAVEFTVPSNLFGRDASSAVLPGTTIVSEQGSYGFAVETLIKFKAVSASITGTPTLRIYSEAEGVNITHTPLTLDTSDGYWKANITGGTSPLNALITYVVSYTINGASYSTYNANYVLPLRSFAHIMASVNADASFGSVEGGCLWTIFNTWGSNTASNEKNGVYSTFWPTSSWVNVDNSNEVLSARAAADVGGYFWQTTAAAGGNDTNMDSTYSPTGTVYIDVNSGYTNLAQAGVSVVAKGMFGKANMDGDHTRVISSVSCDGIGLNNGNSDINNTTSTYTFSMGSVPVSSSYETVSRTVSLSTEGDRGGWTKTFKFNSQIYLKVVTYNKNSLRADINNALTANYQARHYDAAAWSSFFTAYINACAVYNNPTSDQAKINSAWSAFGAAMSALKNNRKLCLVTANHIDVVSGKTLAYESVSFYAGANISAKSVDIAGYVLDDGQSTTQSVSDQCSDVILEFLYDPDDFHVELVYDPDPETNKHAGNYTGGADVSSLTVSYNNAYGELPLPTMLGWVFGGWYSDIGLSKRVTSATTYLVAADTKLYAKWTCLFTGGHGTADDPFNVYTISDFYQMDVIDTRSNDLHFIQSRNLEIASTHVAIGSAEKPFSGSYDMNGFKLTVPSGVTLSAPRYAGVFGYISHAEILNANIELHGTITSAMTPDYGYSGFIAYAESSLIKNVHVNFDGMVISSLNVPVGASHTGILAGELSLATCTDVEYQGEIVSTPTDGEQTTVENCSVTTKGGTISNTSDTAKQYAVIGNVRETGTGSIDVINTWAFLNKAPEGFAGDGSAQTNIMSVKSSDGTAQMSYNPETSVFTFTAVPSEGWTSEIEDGNGTVVTTDETYVAPLTQSGAHYSLRFVKQLTLTASQGGNVTPKGTFGAMRDENISLWAQPNTGYYFVGWSNTTNGVLSSTSALKILYTMGTLGGTISADFAANKYRLVFSENAGSDTVTNMPVSVSATYDAAFDLSARVPSRTGYSFIEWNTASDGSGTSYNPGQTEIKNLTAVKDGEVTFYAIWSDPFLYDIAFVENGGSDAQDISDVTYGFSFTFPAITKTGYTLYGWYEDGTLWSGSRWEGGTQGTAPAKNVTYYARWIANQYVVRFDANGGSGSPSDLVAVYDTSFSIPLTKPTMTGYQFLGWDTQAAAINVVYTPGQEGLLNLSAAQGSVKILYAVWESISLNVTWDLNGGNIGGSTSDPRSFFILGDNYVLPTQPVYEGYHFLGWFTSKEEDATQITAAMTVEVTGTVSYYAMWEVDETANQYTVVFNSSDSTATGEMSNQIFESGETVRLTSNNFSRYGYTFSGWSRTQGATVLDYSNGESVYGLETYADAAKKVNLYAVWAPVTCTVSYNSNSGGGAMTSSYPLFGATMTLKRCTFTKTGYTFIGWATSRAVAATMTANYLNRDSFLVRATAQTLYAVWKPDSYLTYECNVKSMKTDASYGDTETCWRAAAPGTLLPIESETPTGFYIDSLRSTEPFAITENDMVVNIFYARMSYDVSYYVNSQLAKSNTYRYGESVTQYTPVTKAGVTFVQWCLDDETFAQPYTIPSTMPATDIVVYAKLNYTNYTVSFNLNSGVGTAPSNMTGIVDEQLVLPDNSDNSFSKEGFTFVGWSTNEDALPADAVTSLTLTAQNVELFAVWKEKPLVETDLVEKEDSTTEIDEDNFYISGISERTTVQQFLDSYVTITGNGEAVVSTPSGSFGTGSTVTLRDKDSKEVIKVYTVIIFGDVNGDGLVDSADATVLNRVAAMIDNLDEVNTFAGDFNSDGLVDSYDATVANKAAAFISTIDQSNPAGA